MIGEGAGRVLGGVSPERVKGTSKGIRGEVAGSFLVSLNMHPYSAR